MLEKKTTRPPIPVDNPAAKVKINAPIICSFIRSENII
jgi:hypothetical protein